MNYEALLEEAANDNIYVIENADFKSKSDGLINGDVIGINKNIRSCIKRTCVLAEELGHYYTTAGDIINPSDVQGRKQELRARIWAYDKLVGLSGILHSYQAGCTTLHDAAKYLDVTESFLAEAIAYYKGKYGTHASVENYIIFFEPSIGVLELK